MKVKKVNRYYCEYCKKSGGNSYWIRKHEERCTLNPNRKCGFCNLLDQEQPDLQEAIRLLPEPKEYENWDEAGFVYYSSTLQTAIDEALPKLRTFVENCPACIMSALRQKGIPVPMATDFNFTKEGEAIWTEFNAEKMGAEIY